MIFSKNYISGEIYPDKREILTYLGVLTSYSDDRTNSIIDTCISEVQKAATPCAVYGIFPIERYTRDGCTVTCIASLTIEGNDLPEHISACHSAIVFCATAGNGIDRLIAEYGISSPLMSAVTDAVGGAYIEAVCDRLEKELASEHCKNGYTPRFSAGYGDLPLHMQRPLCELVEARRIGVRVSESMTMSPLKSVSAIIGIKQG